MAVARCTVPLSVCPAAKTVQSTAEDIGDIWKSGGSVKYVALSPPAEEEDILATIKPRHWTRPFTPHFRPPDRGKFLVETVIFAW